MFITINNYDIILNAMLSAIKEFEPSKFHQESQSLHSTVAP